MSVGGKLVQPGILRRTPSRGSIGYMDRKRISGEFKSENDNGIRSVSNIGVHFPVPENLPELLSSVGTAKDENCVSSQIEELQGLVTHIRNARQDALIAWLVEIQKNVSSLKPRMEFFVLAILKLSWTDQTEKVAVSYQDFLVNLVTAQGYYIKPVMKMLISNLTGILELEKYEVNEQNRYRELELSIFAKTHSAIKEILKVVPLASQRALLQYIQECQPYILTLNTHYHTNYIKNILAIADYDNQLENGGRLVILGLITERIVQLDAHIEKDSDDSVKINEYENDNITSTNDGLIRKSQKDVAKSNLSSSMCILVAYIDKHVKNNHNSNISNRLYKDFLKCFELYVMPAIGTYHVQFLIFFLVSCKSMSDGFLRWLWSTFTSPNASSIMRQTSMAYLSGFISRAKCVTISNLLAWLQKICHWIHYYIDQSLTSSGVGFNVCTHAPFYAACQAVFYMFVFRIDELKDSKIAIDKISKLQFQKIVTCQLNPLRFCAPGIARNFSVVSNHYQLAYCKSILARNLRQSLPIVGSSKGTSGSSNISELVQTFFPFDLYLLTDTKSYIEPHFRNCKGSIFDDVEDPSSEEELFEEPESENGIAITDLFQSCDKELSETRKENVQQHEALASYPRFNKRKRLASSSSIISKVKMQEFGYSSFPGFKK